MNANEYDNLVIVIHKLYEEMFSVQDRPSGNLDKSWHIFLTLGGVITHGISVLNYYQLGPIARKLREFNLDGRDSYGLTLLYVSERYFGDNVGFFKHVKQSFIREYRSVAQHIEDYINATNRGRSVPTQGLMAYYAQLEKIRHNKFYKPFFKHKTFREYAEEAVEYFEKHNVSLYQANLKAVQLGLYS